MSAKLVSRSFGSEQVANRWPKDARIRLERLVAELNDVDERFDDLMRNDEVRNFDGSPMFMSPGIDVVTYANGSVEYVDVTLRDMRTRSDTVRVRIDSRLARALINAGMDIERGRIKKRFQQVREIIGI
jgi:Fe-S cluster assembly iron-binding protein IscA